MEQKPNLLEISLFREYFEFSKAQLTEEKEKLLEELFEVLEQLKQLHQLEADKSMINQKLQIIDEIESSTRVHPATNKIIPLAGNNVRVKFKPVKKDLSRKNKKRS